MTQPAQYSRGVESADRITTGYDDTTTALEVVEGVDLGGQRAIVTGGSSGIGVETARALAHAGAQVTLAVRDLAAGERARADIVATSGRDDIAVTFLDLGDLDTIDGFVAAWSGPLDILINNAGVMDVPEGTTRQGWETHFGTNHLGHFALATGLHPALAAAWRARIVSVSSAAHAVSPIIFDDLFFERRPYNPNSAYGQSKTANVLFAVEATRRWAADGITVNAVMPGVVATNLSRHWTAEQRAEADRQVNLAKTTGTFRWKTAAEGAATSVFVATSPLLSGIGGRYFENSSEAPIVDEAQGWIGVMRHALDPADANHLWSASEQFLAAARNRSPRSEERYPDPA